MIRTLLVDNYDSFTYNLYHLLAQLGGRAPTVISNDDERFSLTDLNDYDNVVISAGPGHPGNEADFGLSAAVIRHARIPLLGVCLGHQGIAHAAGARLERAREPVHGRLQRITHTGQGLFAGLAAQLDVVCYNSLVVGSLPDSLGVDATTSDGTVMAVHHRQRPQWGLQFHPESACTAHGPQMLENFTQLTMDHPSRRQRAARVSSSTPLASSAAWSTPAPASVSPSPSTEPLTRIVTRRVPMNCSPDDLFQTLCTGSAAAVWLDSQTDSDRSRYSILGAVRSADLRHVTADVSSRTVTLRHGSRTQVLDQGFFDWLRADLADQQISAPDLPFDFALGWVGYLGYELKAECSAASPHRAALPDASMIFLDRAVVIDHRHGTAYLLALCPSTGPDQDTAQWFSQTEAAVRATPLDSTGPAEHGGVHGAIQLHVRHTRDTYLELIRRSQELIVAGETYEVCLTNMISGTGRLDPIAAYRTLRHQNPAPFGALLQLPDAAVLSTSPERFIRVTADGEVETRPIKGTRARGATPIADAAIRHELATSAKDRSENLMIVDLARHDLGRTAQIGSVRADRLFDIETYATVHQMVSTVSSRLAAGATGVDCVRAAFPPGSMTGAPKLRTMAILDELEAGPRGVYSGAIGYFALNGAVDLSVAIRTLVIEPERFSYGVGGAIVALSDPQAEHQETVVKSAPLLRLLGDTDFPDRTDDPEDAA